MKQIKKISKEKYEVLGHTFSDDELIEKLFSRLSEQRQSRFNEVISKRTRHIVPALESIYDTGNINAVMRSAENFGFYEIANIPSQKFKQSARITQGAHKWLEKKTFQTTEKCFSHYKKSGHQILVTALTDDAIDFEDVDLTSPTLVLFGNEKDGASKYALENSDKRIIIPTCGFTKSFNISVAAAITLSSYYQKLKNNPKILMNDDEKKELLVSYLLKNFNEEKFLNAYLFNS